MSVECTTQESYGADFLEMTEIGPRVRCHPGIRYSKIMPHSEVCMHFRKAGLPMSFELKVQKVKHPAGDWWSCSVQLFNPDGSHFSSSITTGEAGVFMEYTPQEVMKSWGGGIGPEPLFYFYPESPGG